jgi:ABC-2 type transport system ATP-binding protein
VSHEPWAIETVGLVKRFSARRGRRSVRADSERLALNRVDLQISKGEIFGLLGPNGAGKTTLVKILATLLLPTEGKAYVGGRDVVSHDRDVRRLIGVVYGDERTFSWRLSVFENLRFYAALYQLPRKQAHRRINELLELVGLEEAAHTPMQDFSSGMKQRASIARGLLGEPAILFLDEPTHNLDPIGARQIRELVRQRVAESTRTVLLATNVMAEAEELCDRVAILDQGRVQLSGTIDELRDRLQTEEAHELVVSDIDASTLRVLGSLPGVHSLHIEQLGGRGHRLDIKAQRGSHAVPMLVRQVVLEGGSVWSSTPREISLEEMFALALNRVMPSDNVEAILG